MEIENLPVPTMHGYTPEEMKVAVANFERRQELARLEREVIEAARAAHRAEKEWLEYGDPSGDTDEWDRLAGIECDKARELAKAVEALESHEAKQK